MEHRERLSLTIPRLSVGYLLCAEFVFCSRVFLLQMEVSFLSLSSRELDWKKKNSEEKKWLPGNPPMLSWRRGTLAISQCLALNLHMVLTALVIWFLRWQIRNSKLQVGRLLVAGTLIAEATADRKAGEAHIRVTAQGSLSCAPGKMVIQKKKKLKSFPLFRKLLDMLAQFMGNCQSPPVTPAGS